MLLSPRKNGVTSLFKEVGVFKGTHCSFGQNYTQKKEKYTSNQSLLGGSCRGATGGAQWFRVK